MVLHGQKPRKMQDVASARTLEFEMRLQNKLVCLCLSSLAFSTIAHAETVTTEPIPGSVYISEPQNDTYYPEETTIAVKVWGYLETAQTIEVTLAVDGVAHPHSCDTAGECVFEDVALAAGMHTIRAEGVFDGSHTDAHQIDVWVVEEPPQETTETTEGTSGSDSETGGETGDTTGGETGDTDTSGDGESEGGVTEAGGSVGTDSGDGGDDKGGCRIGQGQAGGMSLAMLLLAAGMLRRRR